MNNYALGHSISCTDLFLNFPVKKLKISLKEVAKVFTDNYRKDFAAKVFKDCVKLVVNDIIENNVDFSLPNIGKRHAYVRMLRTTGEDFKRAFRRGKWNDVDFITSNFSGYLLGFIRERNDKVSYTKDIFLNAANKDLITEKVNKGKLY